MTWSYSGDPSTSARDEVRFLVGDTDSAAQLVSDEEIAYALATEGSTIGAAVRVARAIAMRFARKADMSVGDLSISYSSLARTYWDLVTQLEAQLPVYTAVKPYAGGIRTSDKGSQEKDTDREKPFFRRKLHDYDTTTETRNEES